MAIHLALIAAGVLLYKPGWLGLASAGTLGVGIVVVTLILSLIMQFWERRLEIPGR